MSTSLGIQLGLDDLLADLHFARRNNELGRLALLAYCEVKGWARQAGKPDIADSATLMFTQNPCVSRDEFLTKIDLLIETLERHQVEGQRQSRPIAQAQAAARQSLARH